MTPRTGVARTGEQATDLGSFRFLALPGGGRGDSCFHLSDSSSMAFMAWTSLASVQNQTSEPAALMIGTRRHGGKTKTTLQSS